MWTESKITEIIKEVSGIAGDIDANENLVKYGLNSLQVMKIVGKFRKSGKKVSFADLMEKQTVNAWHELLDSSDRTEVVSTLKNKTTDDVSFELTDVQYAYWVGRGNEQPLGGVDCHAYYEFKGSGIDTLRLEKAWRNLFLIHPALRTRFENGNQSVMKEAYHDTFHIVDCSGETAESSLECCHDIREKLSHRMLNVEEGETAGLTICLLPNNEHILFLDFAVLAADIKSIQILLKDLAELYIKNDTHYQEQKWSFKNYLEAINDLRKEEKSIAEEYWKEKIENMPLCPELPLNKKPSDITAPKYTHYNSVLNPEVWSALKKKAQKTGVTPAMVLLTAYAQVINKWSSNDRFLINVPLFDRSEEYAEAVEAVADFTTLLLTSFDFVKEISFNEKLKETSRNFINDMHNAAFNGVQVQRLLQKKYAGQRDFAPVVFACNIGLDFISEEFEKAFGSINYMVSQTPQVWIDFQMFERKGELHLSWDVCDELFPENMPRQMFDTFIFYLNGISDEKTDWDKVIEPELPSDSCRKTCAETTAEYPEKPSSLIDGLVRNAKENPDKTAISTHDGNDSLTYSELYLKSRKLAEKLIDLGLKGNEAVAVKVPRGINQIIAIYGVLLAGGCYVPISYKQPAKRLEKIVDSVGIKLVIAEEKPELKTKHEMTFIDISDNSLWSNMSGDNSDNIPEEIDPSSAAYIIMTSGSTGEPKGVEIRHQSAANTIIDVNRRNGITEKDNFISMSAIDFDLSVYDIFGSAYAGGTLYILSEETSKDSDVWLDLLCEKNITVWNTVPILAEMLMTSVENRKEYPPLRRIMLSGDWIPIKLAKKIYSLLPDAIIIAMGGATEASIWSNELIVPKEIPGTWTHIPYGRALAGQMYRVIDAHGNDCPDWVTGELCIGGYGTAKGYFGDSDMTAMKFREENGMIWYHTGDMGRFWEDGTIDFLGRADFQVKVKGHRIELGEIESVICSHIDIENGAAAVSEENGTKIIVFYYTSQKDISPEEISEYAKDNLPMYMVPKEWIRLEKLPVSANGKLDRKSLPKITVKNKTGEYEKYANDTEKKLADIWSELLGNQTVKRDDDYFELGGNSLNATKLIYRIKEVFGLKWKIANVFRYPGLSEMAEQIVIKEAEAQ